MEPETTLDPELDAAVERYALLAASILDRTTWATTARQSADPSLAAKGQRALASLRLNQTTPKNDLSRARKQVVMTWDKSRATIAAGISALADILLATIALETEQQADDARKADKANGLTDAGIPIEAQHLIRKLLKLGVPPSAFDLITDEELPVVARLIWEKNDDYKHRGDGLWLAIYRAGFVDFGVAGLTDDEKAAVQLSLGGEAEEAARAKDHFEKAAGKALDITPGLACGLYRRLREEVKSRGHRQTGRTIDASDAQRDFDLIMKATGLSEDQAGDVWETLAQIYAPTMSAFDEQAQQRAADERAAVDAMIPAARALREQSERRSQAHYQHWRAAHPDEDLKAFAPASDDATTDSGATPDRGVTDDGENASIDLAEIEFARQQFSNAVRRSDEIGDRRYAAALATSPYLQENARRRGVDVPLAPEADRAPTPALVSDAAKAPQRDHSEVTAAVRQTLTRAERNARMKVPL